MRQVFQEATRNEATSNRGTVPQTSNGPKGVTAGAVGCQYYQCYHHHVVNTALNLSRPEGSKVPHDI